MPAGVSITAVTKCYQKAGTSSNDVQSLLLGSLYGGPALCTWLDPDVFDTRGNGVVNDEIRHGRGSDDRDGLYLFREGGQIRKCRIAQDSLRIGVDWIGSSVIPQVTDVTAVPIFAGIIAGSHNRKRRRGQKSVDLIVQSRQ